MNYYVYSTLSQDNSYAAYKNAVSANKFEPRVRAHTVIIYGKANIVTKHLITPKGMMTKISGEQYEVVKNNPVFQRHVKNGFLVVEKIKADPEKVAHDMTEKDKSAQPTLEELNNMPELAAAATMGGVKEK